MRIAFAILVALILGLAVGRYGLPASKKPEPKPSVVAIAPDPKLVLQMQSIYSSTVPQLGTLGRALSDKVSRVTGNDLEIRYLEPNGVMLPGPIVDALTNGSLDAAWFTPGFLVEIDSAFSLFSGAPFGVSNREYLAWMLRGDGRELQREIYGGYKLNAVPCGLLTPRGAGWFRQEVRSLKDLKGLRMRTMGLSAKVLEKMGVEALRIQAGDTFQAFIKGTIDAAEISTPAIDLRLGMNQVAKHYYFPGWHQQATTLVFAMGADQWDNLSEAQRSAIEVVCGDNIRDGLADSETAQLAAFKTLQEGSVSVKRLPQDVLNGLEKAWNEVAAEESARNEGFKRVLDSLNLVRREYNAARASGYIE